MDASLKEQIEADFHSALLEYSKNDERLQMYKGSCEIDGEPNFEYLKRFLEAWVSRHPQEMAEFMEYRKETLAANFKTTGASKTNEVRRVADMPVGLYHLFAILSPNFCGQMEVTPVAQKRKMRNFLKHFPVFQMCEKI